MKTSEFIGRKLELSSLLNLKKDHSAKIIILHGRRRVGKTTLLEQVFSSKDTWKFEGLENQSKQKQIKNSLYELSKYLNDNNISKLNFQSWREFFELLDQKIPPQINTIYFEEIQWLANYRQDFISELKLVWDNFFKHRLNFNLILCGSSPSFIINKVVKSKSLYNRSINHFKIKPFSIEETSEYLKNKSPKEVLDTYLTIGGIPEYLNYIKKNSSALLALTNNSFLPNSFFHDEFEKIFTSSLSNNPLYKEIIELLAQKGTLPRTEILSTLKINSGGGINAILSDLEESSFIKSDRPLFAKENSKILHYTLTDYYLHFYYKFIRPVKLRIQNGAFAKNSLQALPNESYRKWLGYQFELFCKTESELIAKLLGFQSLNFTVGSIYRKTSQTQAGAQFDLCFNRSDSVLSICEIKYQKGKVGTDVAKNFDVKIQGLKLKNQFTTIHKVLIAPFGITSSLEKLKYFDNVLTIKDLFNTD